VAPEDFGYSFDSFGGNSSSFLLFNVYGASGFLLNKFIIDDSFFFCYAKSIFSSGFLLNIFFSDDSFFYYYAKSIFSSLSSLALLTKVLKVAVLLVYFYSVFSNVIFGGIFFSSVLSLFYVMAPNP